MTEREQQILDWIEENPLISQQELASRAGITRSSVGVHISNLMKKGVIAGKGYLVTKKPYIVIVGGVNIDISGRPNHHLIAKDSNPGKVHSSLGGVGRNIAHCLRLLGEDVKLITALGEDFYASEIKNSCAQLGVDLSESLTVGGSSTSTYLFITDHSGDMELAISDMEIYRTITPAFLSSKLNLINHASLCIADTNIPEESLLYLGGHCTCPLFVDTVSTTKTKKIQTMLDKIHTLKPNRIEAELLTGIKITDEQSLVHAADKLIELGIKQVFLSLASDGVYCTDGKVKKKIPCFPSTIVNTTGAGDSFMAALAFSYLRGWPLEKMARTGLAAASICVESEETISKLTSEQAILSLLDSAH